MSFFNRYIFPIILSVFLLAAASSGHAGSAESSPAHLNAAAKIPVATEPVAAATPLELPSRSLAPFASAKKSSYPIISEDTEWSGSLQIQGVVTVAPQATLTILPGTVVRFNADSGIFVLGRIVVKGASDEPVSLTSIYMEPAPADWYGIVLTASSKKNIIDHLRIHGAESAIFSRASSLELKNVQISDSTTAIKLTDSIARINATRITSCQSGLVSASSEIDLDSLFIERCRIGVSLSASSLSAEKLKISSSSQTGFVAEKSHVRIEKSVFSGNLAAAVIKNSDGTLQKSRFISNGETALLLNNSPLRFSSNHILDNRIGIQTEDNLPVIWGNSIYGNSGYNILHLGDEKLYVGGNWFGTPVSADVRKTLFSKQNGTIELFPILSLEPVIDLQ